MERGSIRRFQSIEFPLDEPVNSYLIGELGVLIDAGVHAPQAKYDFVYITHWHWDHVLGLSEIRGATICTHERTLEILTKTGYEERFRSILLAGGVKLTPLEEEFLSVMRERYLAARRGLEHNRVVHVEDCPHVRDGVLKIIECPGHSVDHICILYGDHIFVGDTVLPGNHPTVIDFAAHRRSLVRLLGEHWSTLYPGHGQPMTRESAVEAIEGMTVGRCRRVYTILSALAKRGGEAGLNALLEDVYGVKPSLRYFVPLRTLVGYLRELEEQGIVRIDRGVSPWRVRLS